MVRYGITVPSGEDIIRIIMPFSTEKRKYFCLFSVDNKKYICTILNTGI